MKTETRDPPITAGAGAMPQSGPSQLKTADAIGDASRLAKFQVLFNTVTTGILVVDSAGQIAEANRAAELITGIPTGALCGRRIDDPAWPVMRADGSPIPVEEFAAVRAWKHQHVVEDFEFILVSPSRGRRWLTLNAAPVAAPDVAVVVTFHDVTQRKQAEAALREGEHRFVSLFHNSPVATGISRLSDGVFLDVNEAFVQLYGYSRDEIVGRTSVELGLWHSDNRDAILRKLEQKGRQIVEMRARRKDGQLRDLLASIDRIELGKEMCMVGFLTDITERKLMEGTLRESEARYRAVVEDQTELISRYKPDGTYTFVNEVFCRFFGKTAHDLVESKWLPQAVQEDLPLIFEKLRQITPTNPVVIVENRVYAGSGKVRWMQFVNRGFFDSSGQLIETQAVGRDITERKRAEEALRSQAALLDLAHDAIIVRGPEDKITFWNRGAEATYGWTRAEALGRVTHELLRTRFPKPLATLLAEVAEMGQWEGELVHLRKDGHEIVVASRWAMSSDRTEPLAGILEINRDITESKRAEEALLASERLQRLILNNIPDPAWLKDLEGRFLAVNQAWSLWAGVSADQAIGRSNSELFPLEIARRFQEQDVSVAAGGHPVHIEEGYPDAEGRLHQFETFKAPLSDDAGRVFATIGIARDITERKLMEETLRESEARFRAVVEDQTEVICRFRMDGTIFFVNEVYCRFFGKSIEELVGHKWQPRAVEADTPTIEATLSTLAPANSVVVIENRVHAGSGEVRWMQFVNRGFFNASGALIAIQAVGRDITERKRLETERTAALARLAVVEEQERHRFSRELHDQTAQRLVALSVELKSLETNLAAGRSQAGRVKSLRQAVDELQQQVRHLAWDLRAGELVTGGLEHALREYAEEWSERARVPVDCECRNLGGMRLPPTVEGTLYRVAQEALANVQRHAQARHVSVLLEREVSLVRLIVEDDGCGLDVDAVQKAPEAAQRLGLLGMQERVALAHGTFLIESSPASGTTILVRIPIPNEGKPS